ncbi:MAG: glycerol kinase GlpK [Gemmataceae bacterium]
MASPTCILAIDQGTTSTRAMVWDSAGQDIGSAARELTQHYPQPGWVEHDPEEIWNSVAAVVPEAMARANKQASDLAAIGLTNQRETVLLWERATGKTLTPALVWQDRRTSDFCQDNKNDEAWLSQRTGLMLDPYFSATKINWLLEQDPGLRTRAHSGQIACGTIDSFLIGRLTGGTVHATDVTNASRTLLLHLHTAAWDEELCRYFQIPQQMLPEVRPSAAEYGKTKGLPFLPDGVPILGVAGDQQAALFGQFGIEPGEAKCTYGTGAFFLLHTGDRPILSKHRLLTTLAATLGERPQYALEGSVFVAGAAIQWLRDRLKLFTNSSDSEVLAANSDAEEPILLVPGFVGLGAPHWAPDARGVLFGLTLATKPAELARAALEGVAFQVADLVEAADRESATPLRALRVDGGMAANSWFLQCQADLLGLPVKPSTHNEATAWGAASLAGLKAGLWSDLADWKRLAGKTNDVTPKLSPQARDQRRARWHKAVQAVIGYYGG